MKKRYVIIGLLASSLAYGQKQQAKDSFSKTRIHRTDIQALYSYYTQDNNHSAVTGGIGTEDLQVYAQDYSFNWAVDSVQSTNVEFGADIITSASTDNIDDIKSSASREDFRLQLQAGHNRNFRNGWSAGLNGSSSLESDYFSLGAGFSFGRASDDQLKEWSVAFQSYFDDLRWKNPGEPHILIYPEELRNKEWFNIYKRNSYSLSLSHYQTINRRMALGFYPGIAYQHGLLSTPFHRVYFTDDTKRVENLPRKRFKIPIGTQLNMFLGKMWIVRTYYRFYWDDFGITAHTFDVETPVKVSQTFSLAPFIRLYTQSGSDFFKPYARHETTQDYYTSDYDLSNFSSYKTGLGMRFTPFASEARRWSFNEIELRYALYKRSDGLEAHTITAFISASGVKKE